MEKYFPVICGEWCLFNSLACGCDTKGGQSVLNGVEGSAEETVSAEAEEKNLQYSGKSTAREPGTKAAAIITGAINF